MIIPTDTSIDLDMKLVRHAKNGCVESFESLVRRHQIQVRRFVANRITDLATVDDIAQEAFIIAMKKINDLNDDSAFLGWILSIARNKCIDHVRSVARQIETPNERIDYLVKQESSTVPILDEAELQDGLVTVLHQCIENLGPKARQLVQRFYFENRSAASIANEQNQKSSSIRMALLRIRKVLGSCLEKNIEGER